MVDGTHGHIAEQLLQSEEPSVRWKVLVNVLGYSRTHPEVASTEREIVDSPLVKSLLQRLDATGRFDNFRGVNDKWQGSHWATMTLADLGYPQGDPSLKQTFEELYAVWLGPRFFRKREARDAAEAYANLDALPVMQGRVRTCASQQGNCLASALLLGHADDRVHQLAELLLDWQWPDGGWNCDKNPDAATSTFVHTVWCMRGLGLYAQQYGQRRAQAAAERAAEFLLSRDLYTSRRTGKVLRSEFTKLHYPTYWHYDILGALKALAEIGHPQDPRMSRALDLIRDKELATGGWAADSKYYVGPRATYALGNDYVDWGGTSKSRLNPWVTADALFVLKAFSED